MHVLFTDRARRAMEGAQVDADERGHEYIGTEHLLMALLADESCIAANVLKNLNVDAAGLREEIDACVGRMPATQPPSWLWRVIEKVLGVPAGLPHRPQTPRAKVVIELAVAASREMNHKYVGTEHLLLGLMQESEGVAAHVLAGRGLTLKEVQEGTQNLVGPHGEFRNFREQA